MNRAALLSLGEIAPMALVPISEVLEAIREAGPSDGGVAVAPSGEPAPPNWRAQLWTVPAETRLSVEEVADAVGRPKSWVYRHTSAKSGLAQLPCTKLDGELQFIAGEIREWITLNEERIVAPLNITPIRRQRTGTGAQ